MVSKIPMSWPQKPVRRVLALEFGFMLLLSACASLLDRAIGCSVFLGGLVFFVPNAYFTIYAFRYRGAQWIYWVALSAYRGQAGKLMLSAVGFALVFRFVETLHAGALFGAYVIMTGVHIALSYRSTAPLEASIETPTGADR